ncbi:MAG TPA: hypothetical protein VGX92_02460 [Pyrinomonadaceae bacterium]|jgi:hypothetical protein|nr:hypothetical protein [Pyrinomonadaceae bacterium]
MHQSKASRAASERRAERGGTRLKFLIVVILLAAVAYAGYQYVPVAYQAYLFKDYMQQNVDKAAAMGQPADWVVTQLKAGGAEYGVPANAEIKVEPRNGRMEARVRFARLVPLPFYTYQYDFDHTVRSSELFAPK